MNPSTAPIEPAADDEGSAAGRAADDGPAGLAPAAAGDDVQGAGANATLRKRLRPGERRLQILQALAGMLEAPGTERTTTAALAARLGVSEAALYRHFASKAQMFEGLIDFIEQSVFTLLNRIAERSAEPGDAADDARAGHHPARQMLTVLLQFGEKNPGMARVMAGDALVFENDRLQARMNQFFDRFESQLRQSLRRAADAAGSATPGADAAAAASVATAFALGRLQRYVRSGFRRSPTEHLDVALRLLAP